METQMQAQNVINEALTNLRELRTLAGQLEVVGHRTFNLSGLDEIAGDCVSQLREALETLDAMQKNIKAAGRALYLIDMPTLAMKADAA